MNKNKLLWVFLRFSFFTFLFVILFLATPRFAHAATYYWVGGTTNSNTSNPDNWRTSAGVCANSGNLNVPGAGDTINFVSNCLNDATVDSALSVANFNMNVGYTGTVLASGVSMVITSGLSVNGGTLQITGAGSYLSGNP